MAYNKFHPIAFSVTIATMVALSTLFFGLFFNMFFSGKPIAFLVGSIYITYTPSLLNGALSALIVFVNALIGGYISAWLYNFLSEYL